MGHDALARMTPPASGDFTWVNQGTATVADTKGMMVLTTPSVASGDSLRLLVKSAPATPYEITVAMLAQSPPILHNVRHSAVWHLLAGERFGQAAHLTASGTSNYPLILLLHPMDESHDALSQSVLSGCTAEGWPLWIRFADDGTNRTVKISSDGVNFEPVQAAPGPHGVSARPIRLACSPTAGRPPTASARHLFPALEGSHNGRAIQESCQHHAQRRHRRFRPRTITVASAMGFTGGNFRILIDSEIMKVTGVSGTTLTVVRAPGGNDRHGARATPPSFSHVLTAGGTGRPRPERSGGLRRLRQQAGGRHAGPHLPADRWRVLRARQRLDLGEVRPDLAHDSSGEPRIFRPG